MADEGRGRVRTLFESLLDIGAVAWLCIYPLGCALAALLLFTFVPQGHELLRVLIERRGQGGRDLCALILYFVASGGLAFGVWYAARVLLTRKFSAPARLDSDSAVMRLLRVQFPGLLALIVLVPTALISFLTRESWVFSAIGLGVAILVIGFIVAGGDLIPHPRKKSKRDGGGPAPQKQRGAPAMVTQLPRFTKIIIGLWGAIAFLLLVAFSVWPVTLPRWFGSATIVLVALLGWTIFGSFVLVLLPKSYGWPSLAVLVPLLLIIVSSWTNDNHWPREAKETISRADAARELRRPVTEYFDRWIRSRKLERGTYPIFIVAAEGGGLRAAYWTASVLGRLQDKWPGPDRFSDHVFAISGVSGGGLGAAVFAGLVAETDRGLDVTTPRKGCESTGYAELARCILNDDFLSPTLAALLFSNMCQQFLPYPVHWADRARALEQSWEASWKAVTETELFGAQFEEVWRTPGGSGYVTNYRVPALLVNGTVVEDGRRIIFSNLDVTTDFIEAYEGVAPAAVVTLPGKDPVRTVAGIPPLPLSTFVHMGARFTYVSPAARLERQEDDCRGCLWGRVVDGGYHENSGAATAFDVLQALVPLLPVYRDSQGLSLEPYVILITNDPDGSPVVPFITGAANFEGAPSKPRGWDLLPDLLSPVDTLLSTRESRSPYARNVLARLARRVNASPDGSPPAHPHVFEFFLERKTSDPALGWLLSGRSDLSMDLALGTGHNQDEVAEVVRRAAAR
jgi:hypothetical protein